MQIKKEIRKAIEAKVLETMSILDRSGSNTAFYKKMFSELNDENFVKWLKELGKSKSNNFYLEVTPWYNEPVMADIELAAKKLGLMLEQYVYQRDGGNKNDPIRSRERVPVGYMHVKRLQQILTKKTGFSTEINQRNPLTGQLTGAASVGRIADEETVALATVENSDAIMKELLGARADNKDKRMQMYQSIQRDGYVHLGDLVGDSANQGTLNYLDVVFTGAGLRTDLISPTEISRASLKKNSKS